MEITGKILSIFDPQTISSDKGSWEKQEFVLETLDHYPKKICIANWNNKVQLKKDMVGKIIKAFVNIESKEHKSKWFTQVTIWKFELTQKTEDNKDSKEEINGKDDFDFDDPITDPLPF